MSHPQLYNDYGRYAVGQGIQPRVMDYARQARRNFQSGTMLRQGYPGRYVVGKSYNGNGPQCGPTSECVPGVPICPEDGKRLILNFRFPALAAAAQTTVRADPQILFRPDQLIVPSLIAPFFVIDNIVIGNQSMYAQVGVGAAATIFSEVSVNNQNIFATSQPGVQVLLTITNIDDEAHDFFATMMGYSVQGQ